LHLVFPEGIPSENPVKRIRNNLKNPALSINESFILISKEEFIIE